MNSLLMLLLSVNAPAQSPTVYQSQPAPVISSYEAPDSGNWFSRFRTRVRGIFGRSRENEGYPTMTSYPNGTVVPGTMGGTVTEGRIAPIPMSTSNYTPSTYSTSSVPPTTTIVAPQRMPSR